MNHRPLIALCGYARTGKTTIAEASGFHRASFANALRQDLSDLLAKFPPGTPKHVTRPILVAYGEAWRNLDPLHWVNRLELPTTGRVVLDDLRYRNECRRVLDLGGVVVRLHRQGVGPANDEELESIADIDREFPGLPAVHNDGSVLEGLVAVMDAVGRAQRNVSTPEQHAA